MNSIHVAGVTFDNPDGESRQAILKSFGFGFRYAILKQTVFDNERAVEVWIDSKMVGYVPRKELDNPLSCESLLIAQIGRYEEEDIYWVSLSPAQLPTKQEFAEMTTFCTANHIALPVVQDKRAYALAKFLAT